MKKKYNMFVCITVGVIYMLLNVMSVNAQTCKYSLDYQSEYNDYIQYIEEILCEEFRDSVYQNYCKFIPNNLSDKTSRTRASNYIAKYVDMLAKGDVGETFSIIYGNDLFEKSEYFNMPLMFQKYADDSLKNYAFPIYVEFEYDVGQKNGTLTYKKKSDNQIIYVDNISTDYTTFGCAPSVTIQFDFDVNYFNNQGHAIAEYKREKNELYSFRANEFLVNLNSPNIFDFLKISTIDDGRSSYEKSFVLPLFYDGNLNDANGKEYSVKDVINGHICENNNYIDKNNNGYDDYVSLTDKMINSVMLSDANKSIIENMYNEMQNDGKISTITLKKFIDVIVQTNFFKQLNLETADEEILDMYGRFKEYDLNVNSCIDDKLSSTSFTPNHTKWYEVYDSKLKNFDSTYMVLEMLSNKKILDMVLKYRDLSDELLALEGAKQYADNYCSAATANYDRCYESALQKYYETDEFMELYYSEFEQFCRNKVPSEAVQQCVEQKIQSKKRELIGKSYDEINKEIDTLIKDIDISAYYSSLFEIVGIDIPDSSELCNLLYDDKNGFGLYIKWALNLIRFGGPILIIALTGLDIMKSISSFKDDENKKVFNNLKVRLICLLLLYLIPTIINFLIKMFVNDACVGYLTTI